MPAWGFVEIAVATHQCEGPPQARLLSVVERRQLLSIEVDVFGSFSARVASVNQLLRDSPDSVRLRVGALRC
jgi:hypothetical protein